MLHLLQAIGKVNTMLSKEIAAKFEAANGQLKGVNPQLAGFLSSSMATTLASLQELPATMGYLRDSGAQLAVQQQRVHEDAKMLNGSYARRLSCACHTKEPVADVR